MAVPVLWNHLPLEVRLHLPSGKGEDRALSEGNKDLTVLFRFALCILFGIFAFYSLSFWILLDSEYFNMCILVKLQRSYKDAKSNQ